MSLDFVRLWRALREDELPQRAAAMAFWFSLSLFPAAILLVALLDALPLAGALERVSREVRAALPGPAGELVSDYLEDFGARRPSGLVSLWALALLWASSRGLAGARAGLNAVLGVRERRAPWTLRLLAVWLTAAAIALVGVAYLFLVGGPQLGAALADAVGLAAAFRALWNGLRWPVVVVLFTGFLVLAYRFLPARRLPWRALAAGALPPAGGWILLGLALRLWLGQLARLDEIYGSLASVIVLLALLWAFAWLLLLGGEIAANLAGVRAAGATREQRP